MIDTTQSRSPWMRPGQSFKAAKQQWDAESADLAAIFRDISERARKLAAALDAAPQTR